VVGARSHTSAERVARNDAAFRDANEHIRAAAASMNRDDFELLPFLCECAEERCTTVIQLTLGEYESVRDHSTQFVYAKGHEVNGLGWVRVLDEFDRYTVVEKIGEAAQIVEELDPRSETSHD
jgi:hypothetical protein